MVKRVGAAAAAVVVLAAAGWYGIDTYAAHKARCADGVARQGGECVGVTDGAYVFRPDPGKAGKLERVTKLIKKENDDVAKHYRKRVSVAYMTTFTVGDEDSNSQESVAHELQGAYLAQVRHNRGDDQGSPKIRLLIANTGSGGKHWRYPVDELARRTRTDDRLVAVTGLGQSTRPGREALRAMAKHGLPMVSSIMTATDLRGIPGFVRVAPTNTDESRAASDFLRHQKPPVHRVAIVQDIAEHNLYARTLGAEFERAFKKGGGTIAGDEPLQFDSSSHGVWKNTMRNMPSKVCERRPQAVFFAGRGNSLTTFLNALSDRDCRKRRLTVITGDDTTNLGPDQLREASRKGVDVYYTGIAHPDVVKQAGSRVSRRAAGYFEEHPAPDKRLLVKDFHEPFDDGQAMVGHDAVLTAAYAISFVDGSHVTPMGVAENFRSIREPDHVNGASGRITFRNDGNPRDKPVPVLKLDAKGGVELKKVY